MRPAPSDDSDSQSTPAQTQQQDSQPPAHGDIAPPDKLHYDPGIFQPMTPDQIAFLRKVGHVPSGNAEENDDFHKLLKSVVPDCEFHYGRDMPLLQALDTVLKDSPDRIQIRDARYLIVSGRMGPYLGGRGFMWFDMQSGIAIGAFYFQPTNGEPTPTLNVFSRQVKERVLQMSQLPAAFALDLDQWENNYGISPILTRYFISGRDEKILLAHDEDYCSAADTVEDRKDRDCEQQDADAADLDMNAAYYLEQVHNRTNATEWMIIGDDQAIWAAGRDSACGSVIDPLACRIRMTRERTRVILTRPPQAHKPSTQQPRGQ